MENYNRYPNLPSQLLWSGSVVLLLDGVSVNNILPKIYKMASKNTIECFYLNTRWDEIKDISPCAILLQSPQEPILQDFLSNLDKETGYLLFSQHSWQQIIIHLYSLMEVEEPISHQNVMLRFADPAVMKALLRDSNHSRFHEIMGPIDLMVLPDSIQEQWHIIKNDSSIIQKENFRLTDEDIDSLSEVSFRQVIRDLNQHMLDYFPNYLINQSNVIRYKNLYAIAGEAYKKGFCSEQEITLYANVVGYLGENWCEFKDIAILLDNKSQLSHVERVQQAAKLAKQYATSNKGVK